MIDVVARDAIVFSSLLVLLSTGLTLIYITTKVPNFAHGSFVTLGLYAVLAGTKLVGGSPYQYFIASFAAGAFAAVILYKLILKPLIKRNASLVHLMISTIAYDLILLAAINILADYLTRVHKIDTRYFVLKGLDFKLLGMPAISMIAPLSTVVTMILLHAFLTRTKFGTAMRATIENPSLASVVGVNVDLVYTASWVIAGGLAGLAGGFISLWFLGNPDTGTSMLPSMFAASILGGFFSIYGAMLGGYVMGLAEVLVTWQLATILGAWVIPYRPLIPLVVMVIVLLIAPRGLVGIEWSRLTKIVKKMQV